MPDISTKESAENNTLLSAIQQMCLSKHTPKTHLVAEFGAQLVGHTGGHTHGGDSTRLRAPDDLAVAAVAGLLEVLWELCGFACASLGRHHEDLRTRQDRSPVDTSIVLRRVFFGGS